MRIGEFLSKLRTYKVEKRQGKSQKDKHTPFFLKKNPNEIEMGVPLE